VTDSVAGQVDEPRGLLTLGQLTNRVGLSVRNIRFYTARGLVPPPLRHGRSGYYTVEHVARLELVQELQGHGFTLAAIERYVAGIPDTATAEDIALHRSMLAPWQSEPATVLTHTELEDRAGRALTGDDLAVLEALGIVRPAGRGKHHVTVSQLSVGLGLLDLDFPLEAAQAAAEIYAAHGRAIAEELDALFRSRIWPALLESGASPARLQEIVERLKPLSVSSLVTAYEAAMDAAKREGIERRTRPREDSPGRNAP
jgi:DNA-binding transcriptional MerR regulator